MEDEQGRISDLRNDANDAFFEAAISAATAALGPLGSAIKIARELEEISDLLLLTNGEILQLAGAAFPLLGAIHGLARFVSDFQEIADIQDRLQDYHDQLGDLGFDLTALMDLAREDGCLNRGTV